MAADRLVEIALSLTDGLPVDWDAMACEASEGDRPVLDRLRQLQLLAHVHGTSASEMAIHDSIRLPQPEHPGVPVTWGSLEITAKIGRGAYGDVYRAWDHRLGRDVALKLLRERDDQSPAAVVREGHLLARVRHPNVVTVYGAARIDGRTGLWMELLSGETLEHELTRRGSLPAVEIILIARDLCAAVMAVHAAGLLHRDIKAQNVIRTDEGRLVLMDFGTTREAGDDPFAAAVAGTPAYLAPEVLDGAPTTEASEVFAVGVLLFHLATGSFPVRGGDVRELRRAYRDVLVPSVSTLRRDCPRPLAKVIDRAVSLRPAARFPDVGALAAAIEHAARVPWSRRRHAIAAGVLIAVGLAGVAMLVTARMPDGGVSSRTVTLSQLESSIQKQFNIRAPSWEGTWATCTPHGPGAVTLCNLVDGTARPVRVPLSPSERSPAAVLSPDGRRIAYLWLTGRSLSLRIIGADGSNDRELMAAGGDLLSIQGWLRSSDALLLNTPAGRGACVERLDISTGLRRKVRCETERTVSSSELSPDGRFLAFSRLAAHDGSEDLWLRHVESGAERPLTHDAAIDSDSLWTPDGRAVAFASNRNGTWGVFTIPIREGVPSDTPQLVLDLGRSRPTLLGFTQAGTLFVRMMKDLEDVLRADVDLAVPSMTTPGRADVTAVDESVRSPDWSPDGQRFAYIAGAWRGASRVVVARADGGVERVLSFPTEPTTFGSVRWAPDGRALAVTSNNAAGRPLARLDVITLDDGKRRMLSSRDVGDIRWAPDGTGLYFLAMGAVSFVNAASGLSHEVYRPAPPAVLERFSTFDLSRDGQAFLLAIRTPGVKCAARIVTRAGAVRDVGSFPGDCRAIAWSGDEKAVLAGAEGPDGAIPLWLLPIAGGRGPVVVPPHRLQVVDISVRPGGREVLLGSGNPRPNVWMLSGFAGGIDR